MRYEVRELAGSDIEIGSLLVRPVARSTAVWRQGRGWAGGAQYLRPVRVEVTTESGTSYDVRIPDRQFQIRLVALALVLLAVVIRRMRNDG